MLSFSDSDIAVSRWLMTFSAWTLILLVTWSMEHIRQQLPVFTKVHHFHSVQSESSSYNLLNFAPPVTSHKHNRTFKTLRHCENLKNKNSPETILSACNFKWHSSIVKMMQFSRCHFRYEFCVSYDQHRYCALELPEIFIYCVKNTRVMTPLN